MELRLEISDFWITFEDKVCLKMLGSKIGLIDEAYSFYL